MALRRCVAVPAREFAQVYWDRRPLLARGLDDYTDLLALADVDELVSRRGLRSPFIRMAKDGRVIPAERFTGGGGLGAEVADQVRDELVFGLLADGATLVLQGLHRLWPPLIEFAGRLRADLGTPVQVNAYLTPPGGQGFAAHADTHAVFVLQVAGRKRWRIADGELDVVLGPGDALYLPRGWVHAAQSLAEVSLHLTVGLPAPTRYTLVEALLGLATDDPALRAGLPMGTDPADPPALAPVLADTVAALHAWLDRVSPDEVAARLREGAWTASRPDPLPPLAQLDALANVSSEGTVAVRGGLPVRVEPAGDTVRVVTPDRTVTFPGYCAAALATVLDGAAHRVDELPGLDPADALVLARRLLREAVLTVR